MPHQLYNWPHVQATQFLEKNGFIANSTRGTSPCFTRELGGIVYAVVVPHHGYNKALKPRTLKAIIEDSGIPFEEWLA